MSDRVGLGTFIEDITGLLDAEELEGVVLVGHSFGAIPVLGVVDALPDRISQVVLVDGIWVERGESAFDQFATSEVQARIGSAVNDGRGRAVLPPPPAAFGVLDPSDAAWVGRRLSPHPLRAYEDRLILSGRPGNGRPATYLACADPFYSPAGRSRDRARSAAGWSYLEIPAGHDAMITAPGLLAGILSRLAGGGSVTTGVTRGQVASRPH